MAENVQIRAIETTYDVGSDPQFRCTLTVKRLSDGEILVATLGCAGAPEDCPQEVASDNDWAFADP